MLSCIACDFVRFLIHVYLPDRRQAKKYTTNYNCVIVKGDCLVVVLVFGHHGVSVVFLIKALPALALFVFVNADVYTMSAVSWTAS